MVEVSAEPFVHLHIVTHLEWEREGHHTYHQQRAQLLDQLSQLLHDLQAESQALRHILLSNQTIVLDDVAAVRPDLLPTLAIYNANGRLSIGPWFVQMDEMLSSGESLVRSLLYGQEDAVRHGVQLSSVAYLPATSEHPAQLPQILKGFDIDSVVLCPGETSVPLPFQWEAPDSSSVLVITYQQLSDIRQAIRHQREGQPDGPFLWLQPATNWQKYVAGPVAKKQSTLVSYVNELRERFPDVLRPRLKQEIWFPTTRDQRGRFSSRLDIKQSNAQLQGRLSQIIEPMLALALVHGSGQHMQNGTALLNHAWRTLLQNQTPTVSSGALTDVAYNETRQRHSRIVQESEHVLQKSLDALPGKRLLGKASEKTYIVVWNPHGHAVKQMVALGLALEDNLYPEKLFTPDDKEINFSWDVEQNTLNFIAEVPALGYATYSLTLSKDDLSELYRKRIVAGRAIGSTRGEVLRINNGRLEWATNQTIINNLLTYVDGGDAGDIWHYQEPQPDVVMTGSIVDVVQVEATPVYDRLMFRSRMRIAPRLQDGKARSRGLKVLDMSTEATYYTDIPGLHLRTTFENNAEDHRLRVHLRTGIATQQVWTDSAYGMTHHDISPTSQAVRPIQNFAALYGEKRGVALFTRGLPEVEPIVADGQTTFGLTLLRSVGWLDKANGIATASAQQLGSMTCDFMLLPQSQTPNPAELIQTAQAYQAPLQAYQYAEVPPKKQHSYLRVEPTQHLVVTATKPPQQGDGLIVRVLNPTDKAITAGLLSSQPIEQATKLTLAEKFEATLEIKEQRRVMLTIEPHQVITICLRYA